MNILPRKANRDARDQIEGEALGEALLRVFRRANIPMTKELAAILQDELSKIGKP
jgi:hypothetical protein